MTLAVFTYQGTVALFVVLSIPFAFYHAKNFREYVCNIISIGVCYAVPVLLAFAAFKWVFNGTRLQTDFNLLANLKEFFGGLWMCNMETFDIFPHYIFLLAVLLILAAAVISARDTDKPAFLEKLHILVFCSRLCLPRRDHPAGIRLVDTTDYLPSGKHRRGTGHQFLYQSSHPA